MICLWTVTRMVLAVRESTDPFDWWSITFVYGCVRFSAVGGSLSFNEGACLAVHYWSTTTATVTIAVASPSLSPSSRRQSANTGLSPSPPPPHRHRHTTPPHHTATPPHHRQKQTNTTSNASTITAVGASAAAADLVHRCDVRSSQGSWGFVINGRVPCRVGGPLIFLRICTCGCLMVR